MTWWIWIVTYLLLAACTVWAVVKCDAEDDAAFAVKAGIFWPVFLCLWALGIIAVLARTK